MKTVIELRKVEKVYRTGSDSLKVLDNVNLKVREGDFISIMGPSGSGKSTLLHMMGALDRPSSGSVDIEGEDISKMTDDEVAKIRARNIGFVFQMFNLHPTLNAVQNVELPMVILQRSKSERRERAMELLKFVGLQDRANHYPSQLSGGQKQRVAMARALANDPAFILADEPTGNLDSKSGHDIMKALVDLNRKQGRTVIVVTHDASIASHAKRTIKIKDGRIVN